MVGETWVTAKRFSDFVELRETLLAAGIQEVAEFAFPSKMTWMKSDDDVQQERVAGFSEWLPKVLARKQVNALDEKAVLAFIWRMARLTALVETELDSRVVDKHLGGELQGKRDVKS